MNNGFASLTAGIWCYCLTHEHECCSQMNLEKFVYEIGYTDIEPPHPLATMQFR